ncbi:MAG: ABC transporter permease [Actinobacteria bacterium]|nr:ABC transporter permease [Actinomycetota bacterium]
MKTISSFSIIRRISAKDLKLFTRDKVWMVLTPLVVVVFIVIFWILPSTVNESIVIGVHQENMEELIEGYQKGAAAEEGLVLVQFDSTKKMAEAVETGEKVKGPGGDEVSTGIGIDFGNDFMQKVANGEPTTVDIYLSPDVPEDERTYVTSFVREMAYAIAGDELPVTFPEEDEIILGVDRAGKQVPLRDLMLPVIVFVVLLTEAVALSSLVANEVRLKTIQAIAVTPATIGDVIMSKTASGTIMSFSQGIFILALCGAFTTSNWLLLITVVLLAAFLMAGVGIMSGSVGKDFIGTLFVSMIFLIPMIVPAMAVLFPGAPNFWIKILPSYGAVQSIVGVTAYGDGWADSLPYILMGAGWSIVFIAGGIFALRRKVAKL